MTDELRAILTSTMDSCKDAGVGYLAFAFDTEAGEIITFCATKATGAELADVMDMLAKKLRTSKLNFVYTGRPS